MPKDELIPSHGGYRGLKSFQLAQLVYDLTSRFCDLYIDKRSRTRDQMVQAARSGVQNIAEGSQASGTSKKMELKLTNVARASMEELRLDYEDFLRQRGVQPWPHDHPALMRFKAARPRTLGEIRTWAAQERRIARTYTDEQGPTRTGNEDTQNSGAGVPLASSVPVRVRPCKSMPYSAQLAANAALSLLNLCCHLLDKQLAAQAAAFEPEGGFTERLHRVRTHARGR